MNFKYSFFLIYFLLISFSLGDKIQLELRDRVKESDGFIVRVRDPVSYTHLRAHET